MLNAAGFTSGTQVTIVAVAAAPGSNITVNNATTENVWMWMTSGANALAVSSGPEASLAADPKVRRQVAEFDDARDGYGADARIVQLP